MPAASLSLDLDNEWSYLKTHGDSAWQSYPSYFDVVVPRFLDVFAGLNQRVTVFVVGQDAVFEKNRAALASIAKAGHEIGNHSFHHEPWFVQRSAVEIETEIVQAEEAIAAATGVHPTGFRGPGYAISKAVLAVLAQRGYRYDASTLPTFIGPLARAYYFATSRLSREDRARRSALFGSVTDGLRRIGPYRWDLDGSRTLLEIPVTTFPVLKVPFHFSYVLYLAMRSPTLARAYFKTALNACRLAGVEPSLLLHPLDFLGSEDVASLNFFPAMQVPQARKLELLVELLEAFKNSFDVLPLSEYAGRVELRGTAHIRARFAS
jgi:hypothetical protein